MGFSHDMNYKKISLAHDLEKLHILPQNQEVLKMMNSTKESLKMDSKKSKKPQMEKLRRARINESLNELKSLVLDAMKKDVSRYSKMEKADILEMTVKYLRESQDKQPKSNSDSLTIANYRAGFNECAAEVARYLMSLDNVSDELRAHLLSHLSSYYCSQTQPMKWTGPRANGVSYPAQMVRVPSKINPFSTFPIPTTNSSEMTFPSTQPSPPSSPLNQQEAGLMRIKGTSQVILSNGMPALLVPNDGVKLLPLTWQSTHPAVFQDSQSIWRPFVW